MEDLLLVYLQWFNKHFTKPYAAWLDRQHIAIRGIIKAIGYAAGYFVLILLCAVFGAFFKR